LAADPDDLDLLRYQRRAQWLICKAAGMTTAGGVDAAVLPLETVAEARRCLHADRRPADSGRSGAAWRRPAPRATGPCVPRLQTAAGLDDRLGTRDPDTPLLVDAVLCMSRLDLPQK
jgi:hypothetical protein